MHHAIGLGVIVTAIAFAFGMPVARFSVGAALIGGLLFIGYVMFRIAMGTV